MITNQILRDQVKLLGTEDYIDEVADLFADVLTKIDEVKHEGWRVLYKALAEHAFRVADNYCPKHSTVLFVDELGDFVKGLEIRDVALSLETLLDMYTFYNKVQVTRELEWYASEIVEDEKGNPVVQFDLALYLVQLGVETLWTSKNGKDLLYTNGDWYKQVGSDWIVTDPFTI